MILYLNEQKMITYKYENLIKKQEMDIEIKNQKEKELKEIKTKIESDELQKDYKKYKEKYAILSKDITKITPKRVPQNFDINWDIIRNPKESEEMKEIVKNSLEKVKYNIKERI